MTEPVSGAALVTGASRRIGRAIVLALARRGHDIAIHHRSSPEDAEALADEVRSLGRRAAIVCADLTREDEVQALVPAAAETLGSLSVLVNNASVFEDDRVGGLIRESWDRHMETNLRAPVVLMEAFAAQAPVGSAVVNLLDQRVLKPDPRFVSYALSRNGLWWATRTMAQALAPHIRVNGVGPGPTLKSIHQSDEEFAAEAASVPLGHGAEPEDIAAAVLYLVDARSVTGQMIAVDGGQHLAWQTPDIPADD